MGYLREGICGDSRHRLSRSETPLVLWFLPLCPQCPLWLKALLLKQILKRRPRIIRTQSRRSRSFLLPRHPNLIKRALISCILLRDPLLHRLHALKSAPRIEIRALLARMQLKPALRTLPIARYALQHRPTLRATRDSTRARQINGLRSKCEIPLRRPTSTRLFPRPLPRFFAVPILITMLPIFCCHKPSQARRAYCLPRRPVRQVGHEELSS